MARRLIAFDMKIIYHNRKELSPKPDFPCTYVSTMDELLQQSDVVSLNLPLNDKTKGSFGKKQFDMMKEGAALVNTARGAIVDEEALIEALESGKVRPRSSVLSSLSPPTHHLFSPGPPAVQLPHWRRLPYLVNKLLVSD